MWKLRSAFARCASYGETVSVGANGPPSRLRRYGETVSMEHLRRYGETVSMEHLRRYGETSFACPSAGVA